MSLYPSLEDLKVDKVIQVCESILELFSLEKKPSERCMIEAHKIVHVANC